MIKIYDSYNERVRVLALKQDQELKNKFDAIFIKRGMDPSKRRHAKIFAGSAVCVQCHQKAGEVWNSSGHARAFATLKKTHQEFDPECVTCHTTGAAARGGSTNAQQTPDYANVQCEACHGPGIGHVAKPEAGYGQVKQDFCKGCHTDELSPDFDYDVKWKTIAH
jgi:mono/diheme cytochrome c family protein